MDKTWVMTYVIIASENFTLVQIAISVNLYPKSSFHGPNVAYEIGCFG